GRVGGRQARKDPRSLRGRDGEIRPAVATDPRPDPPTIGHSRRETVLPSPNRRPCPRSARGFGRRFELITLVEAVGIEPTSGNPRRQASTSIADFLLLSPPGPPIGGISERPAPISLAPHPGAGLGTSHQNMTP